MIVCVTLLALAMYAVPTPASAQDTREAEVNYRRELAILEKAKGENHPDVAGVLIDLGGVLELKHQDGEAEVHYRRALAILEKAKGESHPDVVRPLFKLGNAAGWNGRYTEAEVHFRRALAILEKAKGVTHQEVIEPLLGLTNVYAAKGQYEEANRLYKRALAIQERAKDARDVASLGGSVPPPEFIGTYKGPVIERVLPRPEVNRECPAFANACARRAVPDPSMFCVIVIPAIDGLVTPHIQERMRLHEMGHCAGWPADHPGARLRRHRRNQNSNSTGHPQNLCFPPRLDRRSHPAQCCPGGAMECQPPCFMSKTRTAPASASPAQWCGRPG